MGQRIVGKHEKNSSDIKRNRKPCPKRENESGSVAGLFHFEGPVPSLSASAVLAHLSAGDAVCPSLSCQVPRKS